MTIEEFKERYNTYDDLCRFCHDGNDLILGCWDEMYTFEELYGFYLPKCLIPCVVDIYGNDIAKQVERYAESVKDSSYKYYYCGEDWDDPHFFDMTIMPVDNNKTFLQELKNKIAEKAEGLGILVQEDLRGPDDYDWELLFEMI